MHTYRQVLDYGIALSLDNYKISMQAYYKMFKVMVCLGSRTYIRNLIANSLILLYHNSNKTFFHTMITNNIACLNEEAGEASFAALGRAVLTSNQKSKFESMNKAFKLQSIYRSIASDVNENQKQPLCSRHNKDKLDPKSTEVKATASFFLIKIHEIEMGQPTCYDGSQYGYKNKLQGAQSQVRMAGQELIFKDSIIDDVKLHMAFVKDNFRSYWLSKWQDLWPGLHPSVLGDIVEGNSIPEFDHDQLVESEDDNDSTQPPGSHIDRLDMPELFIDDDDFNHDSEDKKQDFDQIRIMSMSHRQAIQMDRHGVDPVEALQFLDESDQGSVGTEFASSSGRSYVSNVERKLMRDIEHLPAKRKRTQRVLDS